MPLMHPPQAGQSDTSPHDDADQALAALADAITRVRLALARPDRAAAGDVLMAVADPNLRARLNALFAAFGRRGFCVVSGAEAAATAAGRRFDLILLDIDAPSDGLAAARRIRALPAPFGAAPLVALTARASSDLHEAVSDADMDALLEKPVSAARLGDLLRLLAGGSVRPAELDRVQDQDDGDEGADSDDRGRQHALPPGN